MLIQNLLPRFLDLSCNSCLLSQPRFHHLFADSIIVELCSVSAKELRFCWHSTRLHSAEAWRLCSVAQHSHTWEVAATCSNACGRPCLLVGNVKATTLYALSQRQGCWREGKAQSECTSVAVQHGLQYWATEFRQSTLLSGKPWISPKTIWKWACCCLEVWR